jgi:hypothetical protein
LGVGTRSAALLAALLFLASGCGQPKGGSDTTGSSGANAPSSGTDSSSSTPFSTEGTHEDTGLPKRFEWKGKIWEIQQDIDAPAGSYEKGSEQVDGKPVYHDPGATAPYPAIYLKVEGKDRYLQYAPTGGG